MKPRELLSRRLRATARRRADELGDDECLICGASYIEIHHRDGDWMNNHPMNLIPLCSEHHRQAHRIHRTARSVRRWKDSLPGQG